LLALLPRSSGDVGEARAALLLGARPEACENTHINIRSQEFFFFGGMRDELGDYSVNITQPNRYMQPATQIIKCLPSKVNAYAEVAKKTSPPAVK
jgi:hypothetical protein